MALTTAVVSVTDTPGALHSAGPTNITIRNLGTVTALIGPTGSEDFPLPALESISLVIGATDVVFAATAAGTTTVAVIHD